MKLRTRQNHGSILMLTVITISIIGIVLATYLNLVGAQNTAVGRSQTWNAAIPAAEAGLEEALTHLNWVGTNSRGTNGWSLVGNVYTMSRTIGEGRFYVTMTTNDPPVVTSVGYLRAPYATNEISRQITVTTTKSSTGMKGLVALGSITFGPGSVVDSWDSRITGSYNSANIRSNGFTGAVGGNIANGLIKGDAETGAGFTISSTVTGSTNDDLNLSFPDVNNPFAGGLTTLPTDVTLTTTNYFTATNTMVTNVFPSPDPGGVITTTIITTNSVPPGTGGYFGFTTTTNSSTWPGAGYSVTTNTGAQTQSAQAPADGTYVPPLGAKVMGRYTYTPITGYTYTTTNYVTTNNIYSYQVVATSNTTTTATYKYVLGTDNYKLMSFSMSGQQEMVVTGHAVLWVTGDFSIGAQNQITILPGASLAIYIGESTGTGSEMSVAGNGILNMSGDTSNLSIFGLPSCNEITLAGNAAFVGTVYAPQATLYGKGGGNDVNDFMGAAVVGKVVYNGHVNFHYDEKLGDTGGVIQWNIASWTEN